VGAPAWLRDWGNKTTREEEAAHALRHGGWFGDSAPPPALTRVKPSAHPPGDPRPRYGQIPSLAHRGRA